MRQRQYVSDGHTEQEAEWLVEHGSEKRFSEMSKKEQNKLNKELEQMFATIPAEFRERAKELSGY